MEEMLEVMKKMCIRDRYMAKLGCRTIDEMVGRSDLLKVREDLSGRDREIDLSNLLNNPFAGPKEKVTFDPKHVYDFELEKSKDVTVLLKQLKGALEQKQRRSIDVEVTNTDRSFGTIFGSEITKKYGGEGLPEDTFIVKCNGAGGQSFGAFIPKGLTLEPVSYTHLVYDDRRKHRKVLKRCLQPCGDEEDE